jgi:hypothetical protein
LKKAKLVQCQSPTMTIPVVDECSKAEVTTSNKDNDEKKNAGQLDYEQLVNLHTMRLASV